MNTYSRLGFLVTSLKLVPEYKLSDIDKAKCFEHLQNGYNPAVSYRTLWHSEPPLTYPQFLAQYGEFIVQVTRPTGDRWGDLRAALDPAHVRELRGVRGHSSTDRSSDALLKIARWLDHLARAPIAVVR